MKNKQIPTSLSLAVLVGVCVLVLSLIIPASRMEYPESRIVAVPESSRASDVDTSDWLTYENKEFGYRFKYPKEAEVTLDGDPRFDSHGGERSTLVVLPAKYFDVRDPEYKNPEHFDNYMIVVGWEGPGLDGSDGSIDEEIQRIADPYRPVLEVIKTADATIAVYRGGSFAYLFMKDGVYAIGLVGSNPTNQETPGWLKEINNPQLTEWVNHYPDYLRILKGVYSTFKTF